MANPAQNKDRAAVQSGLNDLLGNVIRNDRARAGRGGANAPEASPTPAETTAPIPAPILEATALEEAALEATAASAGQPPAKRKDPDGQTSEYPFSNVITDGHYDIMTNGQTDRDQDPESEVPKAEVIPARRKVHPAGDSHSSGRVEEAEALAATPTMTVTLRIPQGLNEWLDGYVHGSWPRKIRKQELVVEALKLAYARRGKAGEEIIETELLTGSDGA